MGSSPKSKSPRALTRQHSREPSVSPRLNGGPAPSPIRPLRRQSPVRDSLSPLPSFNGGPAPSPIRPLRRQSAVRDSFLHSMDIANAAVLPVSVHNPLPRRMSPRSITQFRQAPTGLSPPNLLALNAWLDLRDQHLDKLKQAQQQFQKQTEMPPRLTPRHRAAQAAQSIDANAPFRARMSSSSEIGGPVILTLDDGTLIDMGVNDVDDAIKLLRRYNNNGVVIYSIFGMVPDFKMIITHDGRIVHIVQPKTPRGGRARSRKMGRLGTNNRRRRHMAKTRHMHRTLRN